MVKNQSRQIRDFIIENIAQYPKDIAGYTAEHFGVTRQAVNRHLNELTKSGFIEAEGKTRGRSYKLATIADKAFTYRIIPGMSEDQIWRNDFAPIISSFPENVVDICQYGFTEIFNNAIDHSSGKSISATLNVTPALITVYIFDDGFGIFKKIKNDLGLEDERHAILELNKGKLTTDSDRHSGEGIFFCEPYVR